MLTKQVLSDAKEIIEERGWAQNPPPLMENKGAVCVVQAMVLSGKKNGATADGLACWFDLAKVIRSNNLIPDSRSLISWNDEEGRLKQEVIDLLERAADCLGD